MASMSTHKPVDELPVLHLESDQLVYSLTSRSRAPSTPSTSKLSLSTAHSFSSVPPSAVAQSWSPFVKTHGRDLTLKLQYEHKSYSTTWHMPEHWIPSEHPFTPMRDKLMAHIEFFLGHVLPKTIVPWVESVRLCFMTTTLMLVNDDFSVCLCAGTD